MKRKLVVAFLACSLLASIALAQAPPQTPKPAPELKKFDQFVGKWVGEGESKESPFGPAGKYTYTERNEWFPGGFFLVSNSEYKGTMGTGKGMAFMGYDPEDKVYTYNAIDSLGFAVAAKGTLEGDTWTWLSESKMGGKPVKSRFVITMLSPTSQTFKFEMADDKGNWQPIMEGKSNKVTGAKAKAPAKGKP
ncbi:MAG: DUF1579 family protein [Terriglobales bacterium]